MRIRGLGRIPRLIRRATANRGSRVVVLLYHRVADVKGDPLLLCVRPKRFEAHLKCLKEKYPVMSVGELTRGLVEGALPHRAVAITFDDGYADNLSVAKPILEKQECPATVFVTTGYIDQAREFWWDELESLFFGKVAVQGELKVKLGGAWKEWNLDHESGGKDGSDRAWNISSRNDPTERHRAFRELHAGMRTMDAPSQEQILSDLRTAAGALHHPRPENRALTRQEVRRLSEGGLVEVGAHTVTHPRLSSRSSAERLREMQESKRTLEEILGAPVRSFAYPYGGAGDVGWTTPALARRSGFESAWINYAAPVTPATNRHRLPRCFVRDWEAPEFAAHVEEWFRS